MSKYTLEIYHPNNAYDSLVVLQSDTPFQPIHVGDYIDPRAWDISGEGDLVSQLLRVISVQHVIFQSQDPSIGVKHHINLYSEAVPNKAETLVPPR